MNGYKYIINPITRRKINVLSKTGKTIINNYINQLGGGLCGFDEKTKRCNSKSIGNKEYLCEMGNKGSCRKKKTLDINPFLYTPESSPNIQTEVISHTIENKIVMDHRARRLYQLKLQESEEKEEKEREIGYSHKGLNIEVPDIIDSDIETDIDLEFYRLKEHYDRTINNLLQTFKNCFMDRDDLFGDWKFQIDAINMEMKVANNDIEKYITTHYPSYKYTMIIVDKNDIKRKIDDILKMGVIKYVSYIRDRNATSPNDFEDFPEMLNANLFWRHLIRINIQDVSK